LTAPEEKKEGDGESGVANPNPNHGEARDGEVTHQEAPHGATIKRVATKVGWARKGLNVHIGLPELKKRDSSQKLPPLTKTGSKFNLYRRGSRKDNTAEGRSGERDDGTTNSESNSASLSLHAFPKVVHWASGWRKSHPAGSLNRSGSPSSSNTRGSKSRRSSPPIMRSNKSPTNDTRNDNDPTDDAPEKKTGQTAPGGAIIVGERPDSAASSSEVRPSLSVLSNVSKFSNTSTKRLTGNNRHTNGGPTGPTNGAGNPNAMSNYNKNHNQTRSKFGDNKQRTLEYDDPPGVWADKKLEKAIKDALKNLAEALEELDWARIHEQVCGVPVVVKYPIKYPGSAFGKSQKQNALQNALPEQFQNLFQKEDHDKEKNKNTPCSFKTAVENAHKAVGEVLRIFKNYYYSGGYGSSQSNRSTANSELWAHRTSSPHPLSPSSLRRSLLSPRFNIGNIDSWRDSAARLRKGISRGISKKLHALDPTFGAGSPELSPASQAHLGMRSARHSARKSPSARHSARHSARRSPRVRDSSGSHSSGASSSGASATILDSHFVQQLNNLSKNLVPKSRNSLVKRIRLDRVLSSLSPILHPMLDRARLLSIRLRTSVTRTKSGREKKAIAIHARPITNEERAIQRNLARRRDGHDPRRNGVVEDYAVRKYLLLVDSRFNKQYMLKTGAKKITKKIKKGSLTTIYDTLIDIQNRLDLYMEALAPPPPVVVPVVRRNSSSLRYSNNSYTRNGLKTGKKSSSKSPRKEKKKKAQEAKDRRNSFSRQLSSSAFSSAISGTAKNLIAKFSPKSSPV